MNQFDKELFLSLCRAYDVELSKTAEKPMLREGNDIRPITKEDIKVIFTEKGDIHMAKINDMIYDSKLILEEDKKQIGVYLQALLSEEEFRQLRTDWETVGGSEAIPLWKFAFDNIEVRYKKIFL